MESILHRTFRIGDWEVQPALNRVVGTGGPVSIEPKMMQVLTCLADQPGAVVTRAALLDTVWAGTVVGDEVLSRVISELRKVLGDEARAPHIIETIPRVGYRLIAPVDFGMYRGDRVAEPVLTAGSMVTDRARSAPVAPSRRGWIWAGLAVLLVLAGIAGWAALSPVSAPRIVRVLALTTFPGFEIDPALSPDGQQVAFIWSGPEAGHLNVYSRHVANEALLQLTDTPFYAFSPAWSPDGSRIAFARSLQGIFEVPALGGPARKLADIGASSWADVTWAPDGTALVYTDRAGPEAPYRLVRLDLATQATTYLTNPAPGLTGDRDPVFSPDGRLAFVRIADEVGEVFVMPAEGGEPRPCTDDQAVIDGIDWTSDGRRLVIASNRAGPFGLWEIDAGGGTPQLVRLDGVDDLRAPTVQGERMAFIQSSTETNIWRVDLASGRADRFIASTRRDENPRYSPDGSRIAFTSSRSGSTEVWMADADGGGLLRLTNFGGSAQTGAPAWAPDGQSLVFAARVDGQTDLYRLDVAGGVPHRLTTDADREGAPAWSPDGRWIYFGTNRGGTWHVEQMPASGGDPVRWVDAPVTMLQTTPDGGVYLTRADTTGLWRLRPDGRTDRVADLPAQDQSNWTPAAGGLYIVRQEAESVTIERTNWETGRTTTLAALPEAPAGHGITVAPDGHHALVARRDHSRHDLVLVEGDK